MKKQYLTKILALTTAITNFSSAMDEKISPEKYREVLIAMNGENLTNEILNTLDIYETHTPELRQGNNLFFIIDGENGLMPFGFGNKIFRRINSSANHNNCMLYSIIRNNLDLLTKIMGDRNISQNILSQPECAHVSPEDAQENGIIRRSLQPVREKIFDDIKLRIDEEFWSCNDMTSPRILLNQIINDDDIKYTENNITYKGYLNFPSIALATTADKPLKLLDFLYENNYPLDIGFGLIISLLYETPIIICHPNFIKEGKNHETYSHLAIQSFPNFMPKGDPIFIYQNDGHYQKLTENLLDNGSIYLDLPKVKENEKIRKEPNPVNNIAECFNPQTFYPFVYIHMSGDLAHCTKDMTPDKKKSWAIEHYIKWGSKEESRFSFPLGLFYISKYKDLYDNYKNLPLQDKEREGRIHYKLWGSRPIEKRDFSFPSEFNGLAYINAFGDLISAYSSYKNDEEKAAQGLLHYVTYGYYEMNIAGTRQTLYNPKVNLYTK